MATNNGFLVVTLAILVKFVHLLADWEEEAVSVVGR
jgi:hypothetical protein